MVSIRGRLLKDTNYDLSRLLLNTNFQLSTDTSSQTKGAQKRLQIILFAFLLLPCFAIIMALRLVMNVRLGLLERSIKKRQLKSPRFFRTLQSIRKTVLVHCLRLIKEGSFFVRACSFGHKQTRVAIRLPFVF